MTFHQLNSLFAKNDDFMNNKKGDISFLFRSTTGGNSEFFFVKTDNPTRVKDPALPYYLSIAGGRIVVFLPFQRVLALFKMQTISLRI